MQNILSNLSKEEATSLLRSLKLRKRLHKNLGKRSANVLRNLSGEKILRIEYAPNFNPKEIESTMSSIFGSDYKNGYSVEILEKENLVGGIRAFFDGDMIDLSFLKAKNILSQS